MIEEIVGSWTFGPWLCLYIRRIGEICLVQTPMWMHKGTLSDVIEGGEKVYYTCGLPAGIRYTDSAIRQPPFP